MNDCKIKIKEIFSSIQGEGPYVGYKQLFIRFCECNLNCAYCDTEFESSSGYTEYNTQELLEKIKEFGDFHSISLTGGEPLLASEFLKYFLPRTGKKIYLETNATLPERFLEIKPFTDIVSADIKLPGTAGIEPAWDFHDKFFDACRGVETFAKIVFDKNITDCEIEESIKLCKKYDIEIILQPKMIEDKMSISSEFAVEILDKFLQKYEKVRLIPQMHKFLGVV